MEEFCVVVARGNVFIHGFLFPKEFFCIKKLFPLKLKGGFFDYGMTCGGQGLEFFYAGCDMPYLFLDVAKCILILYLKCFLCGFEMVWDLVAVGLVPSGVDNIVVM